MSSEVALVRYGAVPEVARCDVSAVGPVRRGELVVLHTARGEQLGTVLEMLRRTAAPRPSHLPESDADPVSFDLVRRATSADLDLSQSLSRKAAEEFPHWRSRIAEWELQLELVDLEWTLDGGQRILYVLNDRGPDCTKLALRAAAAGLGIVAVQPVSAEGLVTLPASMSTDSARCGASGGSCGCGSRN